MARAPREGERDRARDSSTIRANWIPDELRKPHHVEPSDRRSLGAFTVMDESGASLRVGDLRGLTVVAILHQECKASLAAIQELGLLHRQGKGTGLKVILAFHGGGLAGLRDLRAMVRPRLDEDFLLYVVSQNPEEGVGVLPEFGAYPTYYILDREGRVAWRFSGHNRDRSLAERLSMIALEP